MADGCGRCWAPRNLESGARLVTAVAGTSKTVLQMPRGNLEDIHPRALVLNFLEPLFDRLAHIFPFMSIEDFSSKLKSIVFWFSIACGLLLELGSKHRFLEAPGFLLC